METIDRLLANNESFAAGLPERHLSVEPSLHLAIVTCMDSRLDVFGALGLGEGEAHVLRNAGGVITDDVIRSLAISQRVLGTVRPGQVVLLHVGAHPTDGSTLDADALSCIIDGTRARGYGFITLDAFARFDAELALSVAQYDKTVDREYKTARYLLRRAFTSDFDF